MISGRRKRTRRLEQQRAASVLSTRRGMPDQAGEPTVMVSKGKVAGGSRGRQESSLLQGSSLQSRRNQCSAGALTLVVLGVLVGALIAPVAASSLSSQGASPPGGSHSMPSLAGLPGQQWVMALAMVGASAMPITMGVAGLVAVSMSIWWTLKKPRLFANSCWPSTRWTTSSSRTWMPRLLARKHMSFGRQRRTPCHRRGSSCPSHSRRQTAGSMLGKQPAPRSISSWCSCSRSTMTMSRRAMSSRMRLWSSREAWCFGAEGNGVQW